MPIDSNGDFIDTPQYLPYGPVTVTATLEQFDAAQGTYTALGSPQTLTFTYQQQSETAPTITALGLEYATTGGLDAGTAGSPPSSSQPVIGGQVAYQGKLQGLTVEIDTNGDGTADATATTNSYGEFNFTPTGVSAGNTYTYQVRANAIDDQTGQTLIGAWQPFTFSVVAAPATTPAIASLTLATSTTDSSGTLDTTDPSVTGTVVEDGLPSPSSQSLDGPGGPSSDVAGLTVQFMIAGQVIGSTTTDSSGGFVYTPTGLTPGNVSITARAVDHDASGNEIDGAWSSVLSFILQSAPVAGTSVSQLQLVDGAGRPLSTPITTSPSISGQVVSDTNAVGVTVELDTNGDGVADLTTTTDGQGNFSFAPTNMPDGVDTVRARTVTTASDGSTVDSARAPLSFVLTDNLSDPTARQEAAALAAAKASSSGGGDETPGQKFAADEATASAAYRKSLAGDAAGKQAADAAAESTYGAAESQAQTAYAAGIAAAESTYQGAMSGGPAVTAPLPDLTPPPAPPTPSVPADATGPAAPSEPQLDGQAFDPTADAGYQAAAAEAQATYDAAVSGADSTYSTQVSQAEATYQTAMTQASATRASAFGTADGAYQAALAQPNPVDMMTATINYNASVTAATSKYQNSLTQDQGTYTSAVNSAWQTYQAAYAGAAATLQQSTSSPAVAYNQFTHTIDDAWNVYEKAVANAAAERAWEDAAALLTEQQAFDAAGYTLAEQQDAADAWTRTNQADAQSTLDSQRAQAEDQYDRAAAAALQAENDGLADAEQARDDAVADAQEALDEADADAAVAAAQAWAALEGARPANTSSPWPKTPPLTPTASRRSKTGWCIPRTRPAMMKPSTMTPPTRWSKRRSPTRK